MNSPSLPTEDLILKAHQLYCQLTGQRLPMRFDRQRQWFELLRAGFTLQQIRRVIRYLQREIREGRRNVGALKLSNLLQPDRFEEDLAISSVALEPPPPPIPKPPPPTTPIDPQRALQELRRLKASLE
jgi:hypothetical protein